MSPGKWNRRTLMAGIVLVALAVRGLIPPGFMPANGRPFSLEICSEGLPAGMLAHIESSPDSGMDSRAMESMGMETMPAHAMAADSVHGAMLRDSVRDSTSHRGSPEGPQHHHGSPSPSEHCVFGTARGAGPIPHVPLPGDFSSGLKLRPMACASIALAVRVVHLPQPRAPPLRLS